VLATQVSTATLTGVSPVGTGIHLADAAYSGDSNYQPSVSNTVELVAQQVQTNLALAANPSTIYFGQTETLSATLSPLSVQNHSATGKIDFTAGSTALGVGAIPNFSVTTTSLPIGTDSITATYSGDADFSTAYAYGTVKVLTPDFTIAVSPTPVDVTQGATGTTVVTITPLGAFTQTLQLSCSGLPTFAACSFSPASITPGVATVTSTMTITTRLQKAALENRHNASPTALASPIAPWSLFTLLGWLWPRRRKLSWRAQRVARGITVAGLLAAALALTSCAPNSILFIASPTGTYPLTVTATPGSSGTPAHTTMVLLGITN